MGIRIFGLACLMLIGQQVWGEISWKKMTSVEEVCTAYPTQVKSIFENLNLEYPGLEMVKKAYSTNNLPLACKNLLQYYGQSKRINEKLPATSDQTIGAADSVLLDIFTFQRVTDKVPRLDDGHLKWAYTGPEDDIEWAWALNRHYPIRTLLEGWQQTGNQKYLPYIDQFVKDWVICSWPYPAVKSSTAMWRGLEVSFRAKVWADVFYELWNTHLISPATQLLILSSLPQHAHYARNFHAQGNWLTMEISGLATVASYWPEFKNAGSWLDYSIETMVASMKEQVYPDGVQTELTSSYHHVALSNFNLFAEIGKKSEVVLPEYYTKTLESMWNYLAMTMRPDGYGLLNNDADLINNRNNLIKAAGKYNRPDWLFIATNGKEGKAPKIGASLLFPFAGQLISRSDFGIDAQYSFFDIGPWGTGHQHNDKLHLSVAAYGRDLLVDAGRFAYRGEVATKFRKYATGSAGHNVILVDGNGQADGPKSADKPLTPACYRIEKDFDYGSGSFDKYLGTEGLFNHTRSLVYVRGKFWIVADKIETDRPRTIQTLWHWHPLNRVIVDPTGTIASQNDKGNLMIIPVGVNDWRINTVKGQESPAIQGWFSKEYNTYEPNTTQVCERKIETGDTFVWVLWPSDRKAPVISTKLLSKNGKEVKVLVTEKKGGSWEITIPALDSGSVKVKNEQ